MCGIAGIMTAETGRLDLRSLTEQMQGTLTHRGPDDHGLFISDDGLCALAHTRLSILDLSSAGHQPMGLGRAWSMEQEHGAGKEQRGNSTEQGAWSKERGAKGEQRARYWITYNGEIYNYRELGKELGARSRERSRERESRIWSKADREQKSKECGQRSAVSGQRRSAIALGDRTPTRK